MSEIPKIRRLRAGSKAVCTKQLQNYQPVLDTHDETQITCLLKRLTGLLEKIKEYDENILDKLSEEEVESEIEQQSEYNGQVEDAITKLELTLTKLKANKPAKHK